MFVGTSGYSSCQDNLTAARIPEPICRRLPLPFRIELFQLRNQLHIMNNQKLAVFAAIVLFALTSAVSQSPPQHSVIDLGEGNVAQAINSSGQVMGGMDVNGRYHASLYSEGTIPDLGTLGGSTSNCPPNGVHRTY